jgi:opacity protein-like surface antigen
MLFLVEPWLRGFASREGDVMSSVKVASCIGAVALLTTAGQTAARAADMPLPPVSVPPIEDYVASGWYLRGDIGMSNQRVKSLFNVLYDSVSSVDTVQKDFDSAPLFGIGVGYQFNSWLRTDITGEYRGKANFHGLDIVQSGGTTTTNEFRGSKSEWLVLANLYADLGTWYSFTPFIGAGIGASHNTISNFTSTCVVGLCDDGSVGYGDTTSKWNFAWALHAGVSYKVNSQLSLEFAYRYVRLGDALSGDLKTFDGTNAIYNPMEFHNISSHDLKFGVRWLLEPPMQPQPVMLPPLMRNG